MKPKLIYLLFAMFFFICAKTSAQQTFPLSGTVADSLGRPQKLAVVFLSGTMRSTTTDDNGGFNLDGMPAGTYQLSVKLLGFMPYSQSVVVKGGALKVNVILKPKAMVLREVVIGDKKPNYINMFRQAFLGSTENATECVLLNPDVIHFHFDRKSGILNADADDLLMIENKRLGYRISYLLKDFSYNLLVHTVRYDGETSFAEMTGSDHQKKVWGKNRLETYQGSMMHFLRSVYQHKTEKQGFLVYNLYNLSPSVANRVRSGPMVIDASPIDVDTLTKKTDGALMEFNFKVLYIDYYGKKPPVMKIEKTDSPTKKILPSDNSSILKLVDPPAVIDSRGSTDFRAFYTQGLMADKRVGDQLPFEYQPVVK